MSVITKIRTKARNFIRGRIQQWGSSSQKRKLWDDEFAAGKWDFIENTSGDPIYSFIEKYCRSGSLLDLGCGSGNTGCELSSRAYADYMGVDISQVALDKASQRSVALKRGEINRYAQSDIVTYAPDRQFDVILFRECIYYIPEGKIPAMLNRYARYLKTGGVFIIRWHDSASEQKLTGLIGSAFTIIEKNIHGPTDPVIVVFRPPSGAGK